MNIKDMSKAPLIDYEVNTLKAYLKMLKLRKNDSVILDLTCNFAPSVQRS